MVNIKEFVTGDYLTAETVKGWEAKTAVIADEGEQDDETFDHPVFRLTIEKQGQRYTYTMNRTSAQACTEKWGEETSQWVGKNLEFTTQKQNVKGQWKEVIYAKPKEQ